MTWWQVAIIVYVWMSALTFVLYGLDKWKARGGKERIRESTLQWFAFLGGWPGALLAMRTFRHKTVKRSFRAVFWVIVIVHVVAWSAIAWRVWGARAS